MPNLRAVEIKAFVPSRDFELSKRFYQDMGFTKASDGDGIACFRHGDVSFLLQDFYAEELAKNLMMHLLVEDVDAWWQQLQQVGLATSYDVRIGPLEQQPWGMRDFVVFDPSGVLWRVGQNAD
jgi:uncharacterized glyoxalase superfamily protein PhnB